MVARAVCLEAEFSRWVIAQLRLARQLLCMVAMNAHASNNATYGSLQDRSLNELLELCRVERLTGRIDLVTSFGHATIALRGGLVERARLPGHTHDAALAQLHRVDHGSYVVTQRLPHQSGRLGPAAELRGELETLPLASVMAYCEDNHLTCTITIVNQFDRAEIAYTHGTISQVLFNGVDDEARLPEIMRFQSARFRVNLAPLDERLGAPVQRRAPTEPFTITHLRDRPKSRPLVASDRRLRDRVVLNVPVVLEFTGSTSWVETDAALVDLSSDGMLVGCDRVPDHKQSVCLVIEHVLLGTCVAVGTAIRATDGGFGARFHESNALMREMLETLGDSKLSCRAGLLGTTTEVKIRVGGEPNEARLALAM